jgi:hypothetical protein
MSPGGLEEIRGWPEEKKIEELKYMAATVPSSWEMCDFMFLITGVTRAFTHQLVRTRTLSYAQQALQVLRVDAGNGWEYLVGTTIAENPRAEATYRRTMEKIAGAYTTLADTPGVHTEDARGVLPTNILTNIVVKGNLRALADMLRKRASPRNQGAKPGGEGEWSVVHREMKARMIEALPWTDLFLNRVADNVAADLYKMVQDVADPKLRTNITKGIDQLMTNIGGEGETS